MCRRRGFPWAVLACGLAAGACDRAPEGPRGRWIAPQTYDERRLLTDERILDEVVLDFTRPGSMQRIRVSGARVERVPAGLRLSPEDGDPRVVLDPVEGAFNRVVAELAASHEGRLQVFWADAGEPFEDARAKGLRVSRSSAARPYTADLRDEPVRPGSRFRIDPIEGPHEVTLRSIRLQRVAYVPAHEGSGPVFGKVISGGETRSAALLRPGTSLTTTVEVRRGDELRFAAGSSRDNTVASRLAVTARRGDAEVELWQRSFPAGEGSAWQQVRLPLDELHADEWEIAFSLEARTGERDIAMALISAPRLIHLGVKRRRPNIVLVSLDTLGAAHIGLTEGDGAPTPVLRELARQGTYFTEAFANASVTHASHASMLTGREPQEAGLTGTEGRLLPATSVANAFREAGYATAAFTGGVLVTEALGFDQGFEVFFQSDTLHREWAQQTDIEELTARLERWLETEGDGRPTFLFLHSYEVHGPFVRHQTELDLPAEAAASPLAEDPLLSLRHMRGLRPRALGSLGEWVHHPGEGGRAETLSERELRAADVAVARAYYHSEITYADAVLGELFSRLRETGFLDDAVVAVTADHGEAFAEHGLLQHGLLYEENLHVPLILWGPGRVPSGRRIDTQVSSMDIAPTLLDLAALPRIGGMRGTSLRPLLEAGRGEDRAFEVFVPRNGFAWYDAARKKLVLRAALTQEGFGRDELFDLSTDPLEADDLLENDRPLPAGWRARVRHSIAALPGLHMALGELEPGDYRLDLEGRGDLLDALYAFGLTRLESGGGKGPAYHCRVRIGNQSSLVLMRAAPGDSLVVALTPEGGSSRRFVIDPAGIGDGTGRVVSEGGGQAFSVLWVGVDGPPAAETADGLTEEERQHLRDLGYVQ